MSELKICRICLTKDVKMYNYKDFNLNLYYEEVLAQQVIEGLPLYFCYICAAMLYKFHKFKEKCQTGQDILKEPLLIHGAITLASISQMDRKQNNLQPSLNIITEDKRMKTYTMVYESLNNIKVDEEECMETDNLETQNDYNSLEYKIKQEDTLEIDIEIKENIDKEKIIDIDKKDIIDEQKINVNKEKINSDIEKIIEVTLFDDTHASEEKKHEPKLNFSNTEKLESKEKIKIDNKRKDKNRGTNRRKLDPKHWLKITLTDEETIEKFKARAMSSQYLRLKYKCQKCYTGFSQEDMLIRHTQLIHSESRGPYECHLCGRRFKSKKMLQDHAVVHNTEYKCLRCNLVFNTSGAAHCHDDVHFGVTTQCKYCGMKFRHLTSCYSHIRLCHRSEHLCSLCGASFVSEKGLQRHKYLIHLNNEMQQNTDKEEFENTYCERCDIKFETVKAYDKHFNESDKHADEQHTKGTKKNKASATPKPESSTRKTTIKMQRPQLTCNECNKSFPSYNQYDKHYRSEHRGTPMPAEYREMCEVCGRTVKAGTIALHMNVHTREKTFSCDTCGLKTYLYGNLIRHQLTHTGEKPFKCPLCDKRFTQKNSVKLHHRTFHLKQPYPKRIRKKKNMISQEVPLFEDFSEDSED